MKRAKEVSNCRGKVHFKQKQTLTIVFTGNTLPYRKQPCKGAEYFIVHTIPCHQHAIVNMQLFCRYFFHRPILKSFSKCA